MLLYRKGIASPRPPLARNRTYGRYAWADTKSLRFFKILTLDILEEKNQNTTDDGLAPVGGGGNSTNLKKIHSTGASFRRTARLQQAETEQTHFAAAQFVTSIYYNSGKKYLRHKHEISAAQEPQNMLHSLFVSNSGTIPGAGMGWSRRSGNVDRCLRALSQR
ncbi:hypothetical protein B0H13DRAFT_1902511 [Mycena leptocephala]|nr:hypothetical protein B0H13DRAFT_1902511 [Mycena leptocephala]